MRAHDQRSVQGCERSREECPCMCLQPVLGALPPSAVRGPRGCKGTRASVASSVHSLSLIQLALIWTWIPSQRGGAGAGSFAFTAAGGETLIPHTHAQRPPSTAMIVIHPSPFYSLSVPVCLSSGFCGALLLYDSLATIVCPPPQSPARVCVCKAPRLVPAWPCMPSSHHPAQHIASDVNSWG